MNKSIIYFDLFLRILRIVAEFDTYQKAVEQITSLTGIHGPHYYSVEKYFKKENI